MGHPKYKRGKTTWTFVSDEGKEGEEVDQVLPANDVYTSPLQGIAPLQVLQLSIIKL